MPREVTPAIPTIGRVLAPAVRQRPDSPAIVARSGTLTYAGLDAAASAAAGALWELGVRPGDRVVACLPNDLDVVVAFHGTQRIGGIWAGIGEALTAAEQQSIADVVSPAVTLAGPKCGLDGPAVVDTRRWAELVAARRAAPDVPADPEAPAGIAFSSGTTGVPKAVVHSQRNLLLPGAVLVATRGWGADLRKGDSLPFTILNMLVLSTLLTAQAGGCAIVMDRRDQDGIAEWIGRAGVTVWNGAPAQLFDLAKRADLDLRPLTEVWTGGGTCPEHVREAFLARHGVPVTATYGLSEAPTVVAIDPVGGGHREGASGQVLPHLQVAAYDSQGRPAGDAATGELGISAATSGPWAGLWRPPLGYWSDGAVRPAGPDMVMTGDIGRVDADGWLSMVDRKKLMIVRGGANISPAEVEGLLLEHPAVAAVAVFGIPDERLGERVAAIVVPAAGVAHPASAGLSSARLSGAGLSGAGLTEFCAARLARYKIPDVWGLTGSLPVNAMGKIIRTSLPALLDSATRL